MTGRAHDERGSAAVEMVVLAPLLVLVLAVVLMLGRLVTAKQEVDQAARDAARAASVERSAGAAQTAAQAVAASSLAGQGVTCRNQNVQVDIANFRPAGTVTVTVRCQVPLSKQPAGLLSGATMHATFTVPVDTYRGS